MVDFNIRSTSREDGTTQDYTTSEEKTEVIERIALHMGLPTDEIIRTFEQDRKVITLFHIYEAI